jgi:hypothetical protein
MRNLFNKYKQHEEEHADISDLFFDLFIQVANLEAEVRVLREEVDFLVDELDD